MATDSLSIVHIVPLSAIDQSVPRVYIRLALCYPRNDTNLLTIAHRLTTAAQRTIAHFPILAGIVRPATDTTTKQKGRMEIATTLERARAFKPMIKSVIGLEGVKTYAALEAASMPSLELVKWILTPHPDTPDSSKDFPAFAIQANLLPEGLVVGVYLHHAVGDLTTLRMIIEHMSTSTGPVKDLTEDELKESAREHSSLREKLAGSKGRRSVFATMLRLMAIRSTNTRSWMTQIDINAIGNTCCLFSFDLALLESVKTFINERSVQIRDEHSPAVTSFSILAAILWKAITRARVMRGIININEIEARKQTSSLVTPVNFRKRLDSPIDATYFGNAILDSFATQPIQALSVPLTPQGIEDAARAVTVATSSMFEGKVRSTIAAISEADDVTKVQMKGIRLANDVAIWSWADLDLEKATLGLELGAAGWARQMGQSVDTFVGCIVHTKREQAGLWDVMVQLPLETVQRLRLDPGFMRFVTHYA